MLRVITCVTTAHDLRLVALAALICTVATFASFRIYARATSTQALQGQQRHRLVWVSLTGLSTGAGIWSTHFVAMLAFDDGYPTAYDLTLTLISLAIAVGVTTAGYAIGAQRWNAPYWICLRSSIVLRHQDVMAAAAGALVGVGIAVMHYTGMAAVMVPGVLQWDTLYVVVSLCLGMVLASASMVANVRLSPRRAFWIAAGLLTLAICSLHFTAMAAVTVVPDPTIVVHPSVMGTAGMALAVTNITMLIMLAAVSAAFVNAQREVEKDLRRHNEILLQRDRELEVQNAELARQHALIKAIIDNFPGGVTFLDTDLRMALANERARRFSICLSTCFAMALLRWSTCFASTRAEASMAPVTSRTTWPSAWNWRGPANLMSSSASAPTGQ